jgi:hypothetical protein
MIGNFSMLTSPLGYFSARPLPTSRRIIETMDKTTLTELKQTMRLQTFAMGGHLPLH